MSLSTVFRPRRKQFRSVAALSFAALYALLPSNAAFAKGEEKVSAISQELDLKFYYSPSAGVKSGGASLGDSALERYSLNYTFRYDLSASLQLQAGVYANYTAINADATVPLPNRLQAVGMMVGASKDLSDVIGRGWYTLGLLRPMMTSDSSHFSSDGIVLQGAWAITYRHSETLALSTGLVFSTHANTSVLPLIGVQWGFAPDWKLSIGFPDTTLSYKVAESTTLKGIVGFMQGSYRISGNQKNPGLNNTYLDFHEFRLGGGLSHRFYENFRVEIDVGAVLDRRFNYFERDYKLKGSTAAYMMLTFQASF